MSKPGPTVWVAVMDTEHFHFAASGATEAEALAEIDAAFFRHLAQMPDTPSREDWIAERGGQTPAAYYGAWTYEMAPGWAYRDGARI